MNSTLFRQIRDIQYQAERLITNTPTPEALEAFSSYNEELKTYLLENFNEEEILILTESIPDIFNIEYTNKSLSVTATIILTLITLGISSLYLSYVANLRRTHLIQANIRTVRGKYASIEFLLKALE